MKRLQRRKAQESLLASFESPIQSISNSTDLPHGAAEEGNQPTCGCSASTGAA
jgi:hypothetical protein